MVRGFAPSADPMLQARMFAYNDAARYRLGVNYQQLPCNRAVSPVYSPYQRDGFMTFDDNYGGDPNYVRSDLKAVDFVGNQGASDHALGGHEEWVGRVCGFTSQVVEDDFVQARAFWDVLSQQPGEQEALVYNVSQHLGGARPEVHEKAFGEFGARHVGIATIEVLIADPKSPLQECSPESAQSSARRSRRPFRARYKPSSILMLRKFGGIK